MDINYIILGHQNPEQILQLINALQSKECFFYLHIDKKVAIQPFKEMIQAENIYFLEDTERVICSWGDMSIVQATINVLKRIMADNRNGYAVLMSGQDYPVKPTAYIQHYLTSSYPTNFIDTFPLPTDERWENGGLKRIETYKFQLSPAKGDFINVPSLLSADFYHTKSWKHFSKIAASPNGITKLLTLFKKRQFPKNLHPYGGTQWWALTIPTIQKILAFLQKHPGYINYHQYTYVPDEIFFHSIFMYLFRINSHLRMAPSVTYVNWNKPGPEQPATFLGEDMDELSHLDEHKLFARKFDLNKEATLFKSLEQLRSNNHSVISKWEHQLN